ncbi:YciI family protein [Bradyrhizobium sp.]|uniref:YciI family protein n=1 Tax=Bradyrhizobium sp. TaxID=376 RepID=UPI003C716D58
MLYAILAYHVEAEVMSWSKQEDAALMADLHRVHDRLTQQGQLGPAARLGATKQARTLRGPGDGLIVDGPFAETKEALLGFYVIDCATGDAAIEAARELRRANPSAVYEIRPLRLYLPGVAFPVTEAGA